MIGLDRVERSEDQRTRRRRSAGQVSRSARRSPWRQWSVVSRRLLEPAVALLTGGGDKPYALGMAAALTSVGISVDFIGSDDLNVPELLANPRFNFLNLRGDQRAEASPVAKVLRVLNYYVRLDSLMPRRPSQSCFTSCGTINLSSSIARC